jgi:MFS family permease
VTHGGRLGRLAHRLFGQFHRDARIMLITSLITGAALSLYWIDFNLYLRSLGFATSAIGLVSTIASVAGGLVAFPASAASDRLGRRVVFAGGIVVGLCALAGLLAFDTLVPIVLSAALWSAGYQAVGVVVSPYLAEHSEPAHRNELFAIQFAIQNLTNVVAAVLGGVVAGVVASSIGLDPAGPGSYRVILVIMVALLVAGLGSVKLMTDDRPRSIAGPRLRNAGEPAAFPRDPRRSRLTLGITVRDRRRFAKLVIPGFLVSIGAGQVIPFLNLFVQRKFGLDLASLNAVFAITSLGTVAAILYQPSLARRFGQVASVVLVQGASIPFLIVLGFSPVLGTVVIAMAVRNSLMNAGNPVFNAFSMEQVTTAERATLAAATSVLWQIGWVIGGTWYAVLQATIGFDAGYTVNFVTITVLYTIGTALLWVWFRDAERPGARAAVAA